MGFDRVGLVLVDHEQDRLVERIGTDLTGRKVYPCDHTWPLDDSARLLFGLDDARLQADGPGFIYLTSATREGGPNAAQYPDGCPGQTLRIALRAAQRVLGVISVDNLISGRPVTPAHAPPLVVFANALATALDNVTASERHTRVINNLDVDLHRRGAELAWLHTIGRRVNAARTLSETLDVVYDGLREGLGYDGVSIKACDVEPFIMAASPTRARKCSA